MVYFDRNCMCPATLGVEDVLSAEHFFSVVNKEKKKICCFEERSVVGRQLYHDRKLASSLPHKGWRKMMRDLREQGEGSREVEMESKSMNEGKGKRKRGSQGERETGSEGMSKGKGREVDGRRRREQVRRERAERESRSKEER